MYREYEETVEESKATASSLWLAFSTGKEVVLNDASFNPRYSNKCGKRPLKSAPDKEWDEGTATSAFSAVCHPD